MRQNDFAQILGDEYRLLRHAYPHHDEFQQTIAETIVDYFGNSQQAEIKVLEGGAGSGVTTTFLLKADPRIKVYAVDSADKMLNQAKQVLSGYSSRVVFELSDLLYFLKSQKKSAFDVFVAVWTIHNLQPQYRESLFPEIYRVLKPGGLFVSGDKYSVDNETVHQSDLRAQLKRFREFSIKDNPKLADEWVKHNLEDEVIRITEKEQVTMLKEAGFSKINIVYRKDMEAIIAATKNK